MENQVTVTNPILIEKIKRMRDAQQFKKPDHVPFSPNVTSWLYSDAGYSQAVACRSYEIMEECMIRFLKEYHIDMFNYTMSGFRNVFLCSDALGGSTYTEGDNGALNIVSEDYLHVEEFNELLSNFAGALWERVIFRMFPNAAKMSPKEWAEAVKTEFTFIRETQRINERMRNEFGIPVEMNIAHITQPIEFLFGNLRGIKGLSQDMRRMPEKIKEFCDARCDASYEWYKGQVTAFKGPNMNEAYDCMSGILAHTIMNRKQFEMFMAPGLAKAFKLAEEYEKQVVVFAEGSWDRFGDFFNDYKPGTINMCVETDDPYELRRKYPNISLSGGLKIELLRSGTKEECIDNAKHAIDELGRDGGLVLQPDKMLAFPSDAKAENLKAVAEFVINYKG